ncbi:unnamed protein product [Ilex paraguariensis]|uniref:Uncharacterized protein n=1 Tax=Ilex paraguariensis TaxID=185542 RepID=A0ABC8SMI7_9AQUA
MTQEETSYVLFLAKRDPYLGEDDEATSNDDEDHLYDEDDEATLAQKNKYRAKRGSSLLASEKLNLIK